MIKGQLDVVEILKKLIYLQKMIKKDSKMIEKDQSVVKFPINVEQEHSDTSSFCQTEDLNNSITFQINSSIEQPLVLIRHNAKLQ